MLDESNASPTMGKNPANSWEEVLQESGKRGSHGRGAQMAKNTFGRTVLIAAMLASTAPVAAQQAQPTTPTPPPQNGTTTPTPAPNATAPTPAPGQSQLPPVQVIQKQEKTPATEPKKTAAKKTPVTPPPVAPAAQPLRLQRKYQARAGSTTAVF